MTAHSKKEVLISIDSNEAPKASEKPSLESAFLASYSFYPADLVDRLDRLTVKRYETEKRLGRIEQSLKDEIRDVVRELNAIRPPRAGDTVAGAELIDIIGSGNFGDVWEATNRTTQKKVAVKVFHAGKMGIGLTLHYFRRGVEAMDKLTKCRGRPQSVIELFHVEPSRLAFSMPLLPKTDLSKTIRSWTIEKKIGFFLATCDAVRFAHTNQVLHRDIKPENILVTENLTPVLTDFDICDLLYKNTLSIQATGSVVYTAPEQLEGTTERTYRSDIYSLGRILHFLLIEKNPVILLEQEPRLDDLRGMPEGLVRIVRKCTQHAPERRYQTVDALISDVKRCETNPECTEVGMPRAADARPAQKSWAGEHPGAMATIAAAAIGAVAAIAVAVLPLLAPNKETPPIESETAESVPLSLESVELAGAKNEMRIELEKKTTADRGGYELVLIPGGDYPMGLNSEHLSHPVQLEPFYLGKYEVTREEYKRFLDANPRMGKPVFWNNSSYNQPKQPVVGVSWNEAKAYCDWAGLRLPSEAEWEWAARAGTVTLYSSGDLEKDLDRVGWYIDNSGDRLHPVGEKEPNRFGLYDIHGNVGEWVEDDWHDNYEGAPTDGSGWVDDPRAEYRMSRGGSWGDGAWDCRSAYRRVWSAGARVPELGFRPARSIP
jgi:formylglycine-generating enzyme required for sulfatase activity